MFQQIATILFVLLVLGFLAWHFMVILQHVLGIWEKIQIILKQISYVIAVVMNYLMSPNKINGTVKSWRIGIWCLLNIFMLTVFQYTLVDLYLFGASFALLGFHLLIIVSKMVMIGEDNLIIEGMLHKEKAKFRDLQGAIPFAVLIIASLMFVLSLTVSVSALDKVLPVLVFQLHDEVNFSNWLIVMLLQVLPFSGFLNLDMNNMPLHPTLTYGSALVMGIKLTIGVIVYSAIMLQLKQIKQIKLLIKAFESDESDIQYLQQRATRFPSIVKKELINLALTHPDPEVRKRAILVAPHAPIISFPQAFIYNLNREKQEDLKELGLRQILKILSDSTVVLDETRRNQISSHLNFQITKQTHSDIVIRLMREVEEKVLSTPDQQPTPNQQPTTEAPMIDLEDLCKNYKVFFDTSSLMEEDAGIFFLNLFDVLKRTNSKISLPKRVLNELSSQSANANSAAKFGLGITERLTKHNCLDLHWEENEIVGGSKNFADPVFSMAFIKNRLQHNLCLITQDTDLAIDMLNIKYSPSVSSSKQMKIVFIDNKTNSLEEWEPRLAKTRGKTWDNQMPQQPPITQPPATKPPGQPKVEKFNLCSQALKEKEQPLLVTSLPATGEYVSSRKFGTVQLVKFIAAGGEGTLFETDKGLVCKIYKQERLTDLRKRKLELMLSKNIFIKGVCWPKDLVFNSQNQFVGYLMDKAPGHQLQASVFVKPLLQNKFPTWKREHLVQLARTITWTIKQLHDRNIIIGDINPLNILVVDENQVFFVDTDSYQVENFPCPVGTPTFTAPELQGTNYADILRTKEHEMFAVATLIFMILFPGKPPYSSQGGEDLVANIKNCNFSYVREEGEVDKKPFGSWRFIWSHLHLELKKLFKEVFDKGNKVSVEDWLKGLGIYLDGIRKGYSSNELFPSSHRMDVRDGDEVIELECTSCHKKEKQGKRSWEDFKATIKNPHFFCSRCKELHKLKKARGLQQSTTGQPQSASATQTRPSSGGYQSSSYRGNTPGYSATTPSQNRYQPPKQRVPKQQVPKKQEGWWAAIKRFFS